MILVGILNYSSYEIYKGSSGAHLAKVQLQEL